MEEVRRVKSLDQIPKPCEYFDLIGGTSTGGIIAILLGRLSMTVDDCIRAYKKVAQQAFTPKRTTILPASPSGSFSATQLESVIKQTIREYCIDPQCVAQRKQGKQTINTCSHEEMHFRDRSCTKTVVLAITKDNVDAPPTLFTTYDTSTSLHGCTIWQVARATSAATTFFKPIHVGRDDIEFIDAGFGYNNPCEVLIAEAEKQFPDRKQMQILSIGTGLGDICAINSKRRSILKALTKMATTSKKVASRLDRKYSDRGIYYRFDVDRGLEDVTLSDWDKTSNISAHTRNYLEENERIIKKFVEAFTGAVPVESGLRVTQESGRTGRRVVHHIPFKKNKHFVERTDAIDTLRRLLFTQPETQQVALVGLGGIGKTQVALHLAHWVKDNYSEYSVLWVPALSMASFEQACTELVKQLNIQRRENEDTKELVRQHLSLKSAGSWLLIIDNIDDIDLFDGPRQRRDGIFDYLPESDGGRILFTTRSQEVAVAAAGSAIVRLREMAQEEAIGFLKKSLISKDQLQDDKVVAKLLGKLNYIPLAIAQAAAYMNVNQIPITEYLGLLEKKDKDAIEALSTKLRDRTHYHDSQSAVMTTWMISFDQIREKSITAARLLSFIAHLEPKAIPQSLLPKLETEQQMTYAIGIMRNYGFLDRRADNETFDMHSLMNFHLTSGRIARSGSGISRMHLDFSDQKKDLVTPIVG
ncbi:hypothetical protein DTO027B5_2900 [Paecilomyces variotii]|nr:hypothetical protein DTO027B3_6033 [Paecilomyces variotii]KAJ9335204.1 hypothetical protein DTO027B5_2900 [Paecilomyces variotii]